MCGGDDGDGRWMMIAWRSCCYCAGSHYCCCCCCCNSRAAVDHIAVVDNSCMRSDWAERRWRLCAFRLQHVLMLWWQLGTVSTVVAVAVDLGLLVMVVVVLGGATSLLMSTTVAIVQILLLLFSLSSVVMMRMDCLARGRRCGVN